MAFVQITQAYWDAQTPEFQAQYKVGDQLEVEDVPGSEIIPGQELQEQQPQPQPRQSGSSVLDKLGKEFEGKMTATSKEVKLPSGAIATISDFRGKHVFQAQRYMAQSHEQGGNESEMMSVIISICTLIDGKQIVPEDLNELPGQDVLVLMGEFSAANFS